MPYILCKKPNSRFKNVLKLIENNKFCSSVSNAKKAKKRIGI